MKISGLIEEVIAPHRNFGVEIDVVLPSDRSAEPVGAHNPAILYGLGNLVENAVDFARGRVEVAVRWTAKQVAITIADDGPGFSTEIMDRIGEPYVTTRGVRSMSTDTDPIGLGLGFSSRKRCWNAPAPPSRWPTGQRRKPAPSCACAGTGPISSGRRPALRPTSRMRRPLRRPQACLNLPARAWTTRLSDQCGVGVRFERGRPSGGSSDDRCRRSDGRRRPFAIDRGR